MNLALACRTVQLLLIVFKIDLINDFYMHMVNDVDCVNMQELYQTSRIYSALGTVSKIQTPYTLIHICKVI